MNRLFLAFVVVVAVTAAGLAQAQMHAPEPAPELQAVSEGEGQPHMRAALASLRAAQEQLQKAQSNKGGHRRNAIDLVEKAIVQVEKGIEDGAKPGPK